MSVLHWSGIILFYIYRVDNEGPWFWGAAGSLYKTWADITWKAINAYMTSSLCTFYQTCFQLVLQMMEIDKESFWGHFFNCRVYLEVSTEILEYHIAYFPFGIDIDILSMCVTRNISVFFDAYIVVGKIWRFK